MDFQEKLLRIQKLLDIAEGYNDIEDHDAANKAIDKLREELEGFRSEA